MSKTKILSVLVLLLIAVNAGLLVYFLGFRKTGGDRNDNKPKVDLAEKVRQELGLTDEQAKQFQELRTVHFENMRVQFRSIREAKDSLFKILTSGNTNDSLVQKLTKTIGVHQAEMEAAGFRHFSKMRSLCTAEQKPKFDSMMARMNRKMGRNPFRPGEDKGGAGGPKK